MNKERREELADISQLLQEALDRLDDIRNEEQDAYDNLPENFQFGPAGDSIQNAIAMIDSWGTRINDILTRINDFSSGLITIDQANMTLYKRLDVVPNTQSCAISNHSITINRYNDKSFVIRGNTRAISEKLKEFGAKFNRGLNGGAGWIISNKQENDFRRTFSQYI